MKARFKYLVIEMLLLNIINVYPQQKIISLPKELFIIPHNISSNMNLGFIKIKDRMTNKKYADVELYPLHNYDFWEYVVIDTTTFMGISELKYSVVKEILGDTLMPNGFIYKIIKWEKCSNSVSEEPYYEYQRKDSSKVFIYFSGLDYLLYDFSLPVGAVYQSHYAGLSWKVLNKYTVTGFNDTLTAVDFQLQDQNLNIKRSETVTENFGLTHYMGDINISPYLPKGSLFGGIINDSTYGYLLAKRQKMNWNEFYPLHVGDFWKYKGNEGVFEITRYIKVIKDTLMPDNNIYKMLEDKKIGGPNPSENLYYERIDSSGIVLDWNSANSISVVKHKFSACLGDTSSEGSPNPSYSCYRINDKSFEEIYIYMYPDLIYVSYDFVKGFGLYQQTIEGSVETLVGAVINKKATGDTSITSIYERKNIIPSGLTLYQNYPNPFNPATKIKYSILKRAYVSLKVYDLLGRIVQTLVNEEKPAGEYTVTFSAKNLSSGVYIYTLNVNGNSSSRKLTLIK